MKWVERNSRAQSYLDDTGQIVGDIEEDVYRGEILATCAGYHARFLNDVDARAFVERTYANVQEAQRALQEAPNG